MPTREPSVVAAGTLGRRWRRADFATDSRTLARRLIGRWLVRRLESGELLAGRIVETEAYVGVKDRASHAFGGRRTERNEAMYGPPGRAYVYFTYGLHHCMNIVCGRRGEPVAVLIRALEPGAGIEVMHRHRVSANQTRTARAIGIDTHRLCRGPACVCQALAIDRGLNGIDLTRDTRLWVAESRRGETGEALGRVVRTPRIGVDYAGAWADRPLRWVVAGHRSASGKRGVEARKNQ